MEPGVVIRVWSLGSTTITVKEELYGRGGGEFIKCHGVFYSFI